MGEKLSYEQLELELWRAQVMLLQTNQVAANYQMQDLQARIAEREQWLQRQAQSTPSL